jgi:UDP-N-acetylglucosamine 2-epimerase
MLKVITLVGTRPELIKLAAVIGAMDREFEHLLVHTGQNHDFELNQVFFDDLGIREPDVFLDVAGDSAAATIARTIERFDMVIEKERPDAMLLLGDTNSGLAVISAKRRQVPIFHMEAGNRCFDQRVPEEINRRIIDHTSDVNLVYTEHARRYLLAEGVSPDTVIKTGSPMPEVLARFARQIEESDVLEKMGLEEYEYFLVSAHREENVDSKERLATLVNSLADSGRKFKKRVIFSTHPRTRHRMEDFEIVCPPEIELSKPFGFFDYVKLQKKARCVLSDSGTLTEESSILGFPSIMIREAHERPEGMDESSVIMAGLDSNRIMQAIEMHLRQAREEFQLPNDYSPNNVSEKVVRTILSYVDFINRTVWHK